MTIFSGQIHPGRHKRCNFLDSSIGPVSTIIMFTLFSTWDAVVSLKKIKK